jgi:hypothetical protein
MIHEFRIYDFAPGAAQGYLKLFQSEGLPLITRHLPLLGYWFAESGTLNRLVHLWVYESAQDRVRRRASLLSDRNWVEEFLPKGMPMIQRQESVWTEPLRLPGDVQARSQTSLLHRAAMDANQPVLADRYRWWKASRRDDGSPMAWRVLTGSREGEIWTMSIPTAGGQLTDPEPGAELLRASAMSVI